MSTSDPTQRSQLAADALEYHATGRPGKLAIRATKPMDTQRDLALAYSPGVAEPCLAIADRPEAVFDYTARGNLVGVVTNGTAVLGLGNIGPEASKPVMEGKAVLFKRFADIDVFDIELNTPNADAFIAAVTALEPTFGGINLEDIRAPECFYIEQELKSRLQIPVFHDDQHGTAIIATAAFLNAVALTDQDVAAVRCVFNGAGAAAIACANLFVLAGVQPSNIIMCDSRGVIYRDRVAGMNPYKARFATDAPARTLSEALVGADVFVGVSVGGVLSGEMVKSMSASPIIFALANPDPEISYEEARMARPDAIIATGRSDYPNQVNNVLGFPFIFRGALDVRATGVSDAMKMAAVRALVALTREDVPDEVRRAYDDAQLSFGPEYIIPKPFDHRALLRIAPAVAKAAMDSGVARVNITDWDAYQLRLTRILGREREVMRKVFHKAMESPRTVVFPDGDHVNIIRAARIVVDEGIARPVLLGKPDAIVAQADAAGVSLDGVTLLDPMTDSCRQRYAANLWEQRQRKGLTEEEAMEMMGQGAWFGAMRVHLGEADAMIGGLRSNYRDFMRPALQVIGVRHGIKRVCGAQIVILPERLLFFADTTVNKNPDAETLGEVALATARLATSLGITPHVALLSFSNFGSNPGPESDKITAAMAYVKALKPDLDIEGEIQAGLALDHEQLKQRYPFAGLTEAANVLIFPDLNSSHIAYKLMGSVAHANLIGPMLMGMERSVNVLERDSTVGNIVNMTAITVVQARQKEARWKRRQMHLAG
ncbi:MAG: NADP-dependent malic enzyme [Myxococcales bacterium]|nr:NADP-dependent malic enzyme [Myxococcales bacterium]